MNVIKPPTPIAEILAALKATIVALSEYEDTAPRWFLRRLEPVSTIHEFRDLVRELGSAVHSKDAWDGGSRRFHDGLVEIGLHVARIEAFFKMKFWPSSPQQQQSWTHFVLTESGGRIRFESDGALEVSLIDTTLSGTTLTLDWEWSPAYRASSSSAGFKLKLDENQAKQFKHKLADLRAFQYAMKWKN